MDASPNLQQNGLNTKQENGCPAILPDVPIIEAKISTANGINIQTDKMQCVEVNDLEHGNEADGNSVCHSNQQGIKESSNSNNSVVQDQKEDLSQMSQNYLMVPAADGIVHAEHHERTSAIMSDDSGHLNPDATIVQNGGTNMVRTKSGRRLTYERNDDEYDSDDFIGHPIPAKRPSVIIRSRSCSFNRGKPASTTKFTREQKLNLVCVCMVSFTASFSMSIIAPFFPKEASLKGMREAVSGFVFSIYALVMMLFAPVFGKILPHAGVKFIYISGVLFTGVSNILFGFLDLINDLTTFTVMCFVVRSFEAIGASAFTTSAYTYLMHLFPNSIGTAFGITETFVGLGMSIGPAAGGLLYTYGGYGLPFYTLGVLVLVNVPICWYFMRPIAIDKPKATTPNIKKKSYKHLLAIPEVVVLSVVVVVASQGTAFLDPTLEPYLRTQYDLDAQIVGGLFLVFSVSYSLFSVLTGWLSGRSKNKYPIMILGLFLMSVSLVMTGPPSVIPVDESPWLSIAGIVLMGASFALSYIPTFETILIIALYVSEQNHGFTESIGMYALVSGLWSSMFSLGEVTGPSLGGVLSDILSFPIASFVMAAMAFMTGIVTLITYCCSRKHPHVKIVRNGSMRASKKVSDLLKSTLDDKTALIHSSHKSYGTNNHETA